MVNEKVDRFYAALADKSGNLRSIDRIVLVPITGRVRWEFVSKGEVLLSLTAEPDEFADMLEATRLFLQLACSGQGN